MLNYERYVSSGCEDSLCISIQDNCIWLDKQSMQQCNFCIFSCAIAFKNPKNRYGYASIKKDGRNYLIWFAFVRKVHYNVSYLLAVMRYVLFMLTFTLFGRFVPNKAKTFANSENTDQIFRVRRTFFDMKIRQCSPSFEKNVTNRLIPSPFMSK